MGRYRDRSGAQNQPSLDYRRAAAGFLVCAAGGFRLGALGESGVLLAVVSKGFIDSKAV
jgi:hypothetical protein